MKYELIIDPSKEESLILTVHERNDFVNAIEELLLDKNAITAYRNDEAVKIPINEISCFFTDKNKVCILCDGEKYHIKER